MKIAHRLAHVKPSLTLAVTAKAAELKAQGHDIISFGAGEPDFNTPQPIIDAAKKALDEGKTKYTPVPGLMALRESIAKWYHRHFGVDAVAGIEQGARKGESHHLPQQSETVRTGHGHVCR